MLTDVYILQFLVDALIQKHTYIYSFEISGLQCYDAVSWIVFGDQWLELLYTEVAICEHVLFCLFCIRQCLAHLCKTLWYTLWQSVHQSVPHCLLSFHVPWKYVLSEWCTESSDSFLVLNIFCNLYSYGSALSFHLFFFCLRCVRVQHGHWSVFI